MHKDAVKVIVVDAADNILVLRRSGTHPYYPYHADFPGGDIEPDETIEEALIRELYEETGIMTDIEQLLHISTSDNHYGTKYHMYELRTNEVAPEVLISWEHDAHEWKQRDMLTQEPTDASLDSFYRLMVEYLQQVS